MSTKDRLLKVMPHIRLAIEMAKLEFPDGKVSLSVTGQDIEHGRVVASFDVSFLEDVAEVLDVKDKPAWSDD